MFNCFKKKIAENKNLMERTIQDTMSAIEDVQEHQLEAIEELTKLNRTLSTISEETA
jgi:hypothetical protein